VGVTDPTADHEPASTHDGVDVPSAADRAMPAPGYDEWIERHEERLAEQRRSAIEAGRRKGGVAGAAMAGAMLAVAEIYEGPPKEDAPVTVEASSDPTDLERDGIDVTVGDVGLAAPPLERMDPVVGDQRKRPQV
jgi:aspartate/methionine/tyrosine aminotransferase